jgi:small subunit ribosomal protein S9
MVEKEAKPKKEAGKKDAEKKVESVKSKKTETKTTKEKKKTPKIVFTVGKRKRAVARATFKKGTGKITINSRPMELVHTELAVLKMKEPLILAGDVWKSFDIDINVKGGGPMGQAEACRQAIARGLVDIFGEELKKTFLSYDRNLLVSDHRRTEPHKPPRSSKGARRYKQRSKR